MAMAAVMAMGVKAAMVVDAKVTEMREMAAVTAKVPVADTAREATFVEVKGMPVAPPAEAAETAKAEDAVDRQVTKLGLLATLPKPSMQAGHSPDRGW